MEDNNEIRGKEDADHDSYDFKYYQESIGHGQPGELIRFVPKNSEIRYSLDRYHSILYICVTAVYYYDDFVA